MRISFIDYLILLLLLVLPPAALNLQSYVQKESEIILSLENLQVSQNKYDAVVFGTIKNTRQTDLQFITARYSLDENNIKKIYPAGFTGKLTILKPGETRKTGFSIFTGSFNRGRLDFIFNEVASDAETTAEYNISDFDIDISESLCKDNTDAQAQKCYQPVLKAIMTNTGDSTIYSAEFIVRFYTEKGPGSIRNFKVKTGERLDKWLPGKTLNVEIEHDRDLEFNPARFDYYLNIL